MKLSFLGILRLLNLRFYIYLIFNYVGNYKVIILYRYITGVELK